MLTQPSPYERKTHKLSQGLDRDIEIYDENNPLAVVRMAPPELAKLILEVPEGDRIGFEDDLREELKPSSTENLLRLNFWIEYMRAQMTPPHKMYLTNIVRGACPPQYFILHFTKKKSRIKWILCPPAQYEARLEEALDYGLARLREILSLPLINSKGYIDSRLADIILKITQFLDAKINGAIASKIQIDQRTAMIQTSMADLNKAIQTASIADLDAKIKELEYALDGPKAPTLMADSREVIEVQAEARVEALVASDPIAEEQLFQPIAHGDMVVRRVE